MCWNISGNSNSNENTNHNNTDCLSGINTGKIISCLSVLSNESNNNNDNKNSNDNNCIHLQSKINNRNKNSMKSRHNYEDDDYYDTNDNNTIMLVVGSIDGSVTFINMKQQQPQPSGSTTLITSDIICSTKSSSSNY